MPSGALLMAHCPFFCARVPTMRKVSRGNASRASLRRLASGAGPVPGVARLAVLGAVDRPRLERRAARGRLINERLEWFDFGNRLDASAWLGLFGLDVGAESAHIVAAASRESQHQH